MTDLYETAEVYGVKFDGTLVGHEYHKLVDHEHQYSLAEVRDRGGKISRVRILGDRGVPYRDISYIHATLPGGQVVPVRVEGGVGIRANDLFGFFIRWANAEGVYAKGLGLLDRSNWSILIG